MEEFDFWEKRIVFYLSKMITDQLHAGDNYDKIQKCIHVSILDFIHFPGDDRCYRKITLCDTETGESIQTLWKSMFWSWESYRRKTKNEEGTRAVDALFQCKEPEGVGRDGKAE